MKINYYRYKFINSIIYVIAIVIPVLIFCNASDEKLKDIRLPDGFSMEYFAADVPNARSLAIGEKGTVFVGTRTEGKIYALVDTNKDNRAEKVIIIAEGLNSPNGVAFRKGSLYVAEISRIIRFDNIEENLTNPGKPEVVYDKFPKDGHHGWKFIAFGPDDKLYVPVGAPCNICLPEKPVFETITRINADGSDFEIFAHGIRNTVGFDWHPQTHELWFTENGRDWLGDNKPPDELNNAPHKGMHFGFPFCHGKGVPDPEYGKGKDCSKYTPPVQELGPHVAALGMRFYTGKQFPPDYHNQIFIAEHGSWNRLVPIGYRITLVKLKGNKAVSYEVFAEGWLNKLGAWGRPVDVLVMPDGALLVSDDKAGAVYRISYSK